MTAQLSPSLRPCAGCCQTRAAAALQAPHSPCVLCCPALCCGQHQGPGPAAAVGLVVAVLHPALDGRVRWGQAVVVQEVEQQLQQLLLLLEVPAGMLVLLVLLLLLLL